MDARRSRWIELLELAVKAPWLRCLPIRQLLPKFGIGGWAMHQALEEGHEVERGSADEDRPSAATANIVDGRCRGDAPARRVKLLVGLDEVDEVMRDPSSFG